MIYRLTFLCAILGLAAASSPVLACTLCIGDYKSRLSLRQEVEQAKMVLYGTITKSRLVPGTANGISELRVDGVLKSHDFLGKRQTIELPRYLPVDPKDPPRFLVFCDIFDGKVDPYRGIPAKSPALVEYVKEASRLDPKDSTRALLYFFRHLDDRDPEIANDAFLEFAKANDAEVGAVASKLSADKLRALLQDTQTPVERLSLYAFLLGACGGDREAVLLRNMVQNPDERAAKALGGILGGYIQLRPREGWELTERILRDATTPFPERLSVLGMVRFYHGWKPEEYRREIVRCLGWLLPQGDMADLAIEDLRRWQIWDLTDDVLSFYGKDSHKAPIMKRTIIRYALSCPRPEAARFIREQRQADPGLVRDVEESLMFDK